MDFVNIHGQRVTIAGKRVPVKRAVKPDESFHKGWRVVGIPPGQYEAEKVKHDASRQKAIEDHARHSEKFPGWRSDIPKEFPGYTVWSAGFKLKPVRAKPYELEDAAKVCADLAKKAGWDRVFVVELKHEAQKP